MSKRFDGREDARGGGGAGGFGSHASPSVQVRRATVSLSSNQFVGSHPAPFLPSPSFAVPCRASVQEPINIVVPASADTDEASAMAAMFAASSQQWAQTQEQMAS